LDIYILNTYNAAPYGLVHLLCTCGQLPTVLMLNFDLTAFLYFVRSI